MEPYADPELEAMREKVHHTRDSFEEKLGAIEHSVSDQAKAVVHAGEEVVDNAQKAVDLDYQAGKRPWMVFGGAVALGLIGGRLLLPSREPRREHRDENRDEDRQETRRRDRDDTSGSSKVLHFLNQTFGDIGDLATTAATGVLVRVAESMLNGQQAEQPADQGEPAARI